MGQYQNNITTMSVKEIKKYLDFITNSLTELIINRQIYLDVHNALISQKANKNMFIAWMMKNYYQVLILNLCKLLEPKKSFKHRKTLKHFINLCKEPANLNNIKEARLAIKQNITNIDIGKIIDLDLSDEINQLFDTINFEDDLTKINDIHKRLKSYRDEKLSHLTDINVENDLSFNELHSFIDEIEEIMKKYCRLFGIEMVFDHLKCPNLYFNFNLKLK